MLVSSSGLRVAHELVIAHWSKERSREFGGLAQEDGSESNSWSTDRDQIVSDCIDLLEEFKLEGVFGEQRSNSCQYI